MLPFVSVQSDSSASAKLSVTAEQCECFHPSRAWRVCVNKAKVKRGAGSIDGDAGMRFIRTESAVAAITEAIDFSAYNTSAGAK